MQRPLFDDGPPPAVRGRLFLAIFPEPAVARRAARLAASLRAQLQLAGKPMAAGRLHVSLLMIDRKFEGPLPRGRVALVERALGRVRWPRVGVHFDHAQSFPGRRVEKPFVLVSSQPQPSLMALSEQLVTVLGEAGVVKKGEYEFRPHLTMLYDDRVIDPMPVEPLRWTASGFDLVHSHIGLSRYDHLASWPLQT